MVEVFKTDITCPEAANEIVDELHHQFPLASATFDLEDCDRVLRICGTVIYTNQIVELISARGYLCEVLP
jgi:hypothetical protein